jgi:hypothetical protein
LSQGFFAGFDDAYERRKERARADQAEQSRRGRDVGPLPEVTPEDAATVDACRQDLRLFLETFLAGTFTLNWSPDHLRAIATLEDVILHGGQFALAMPRGNGKTSLVFGAIVWAICYGHRRLICVGAATGPKAKLIVDSIKMSFEANERIGQCFPAACHPIRALEGVNNRAAGQTLSGERTRIAWAGNELIFPTVEGSPSSGVVVHACGLLGSIRGYQKQNAAGEMIRPDLVLLDDPQTDESAKQPAQTQKRLKTITKAWLELAGPNMKIAAVCPCTVIQPGDLADTILDREKCPEWRGHRTRLMQSMPSEAAMELWQTYREKRRDSLREHEDIRAATEFYRDNLAAMQDGAVASWPDRYESEHADAIQYAMDKWAKNEESFYAEYQNEPREEAEEGIETLKAAELLPRVNGTARGDIPAWCETLTAFADVQQDVLPWMVVAWGKDLRGHVVDYGAWPEQRLRYYNLREVSPTLRDATAQPTVEAGVEAGLHALANELFDEYGDRLAWFGVDANWELSKQIVYDAARTFPRLQPFHGRFVGGASLPMSNWKRKPGERPGHFWRTALEGRTRVVQVDINSWKTMTAKRLKGDPAKGITWFGSKPYHHEMLCDQLSAEFAVRVSGRGRKVDEWKNRPGRDNHWWDCLVGCAVGASVAGVELPGQKQQPKRQRRPMRERYQATIRQHAPARTGSVIPP